MDFMVVHVTGTLISIRPLPSQVSQSSSPKHSGQLINVVSENSPDSTPLAPFSAVSFFGTITQPSGVKPSGFQSALGGAAAGAAAGTAIMPGWGTAIGAGVGLLGSLF